MYYVTMTDKFMSGWGLAKDKINKLVIVCQTIEQASMIERAARRRPEMKRVNLCLNKPSYPAASYLTSWKDFSELGGSWLEA